MALFPGVSNRTFSNRTQSNSNLIEFNRTTEFDCRTQSNKKKKGPIERNRMFRISELLICQSKTCLDWFRKKKNHLAHPRTHDLPLFLSSMGICIHRTNVDCYGMMDQVAGVRIYKKKTCSCRLCLTSCIQLLLK